MPHANALPIPTELEPLSLDVYSILADYTAFPWPLMQAQCRRQGIDPRVLTPTTLGEVIRGLALGVARFNDVRAGFEVRQALVALQRSVIVHPRGVDHRPPLRNSP